MFLRTIAESVFSVLTTQAKYKAFKYFHVDKTVDVMDGGIAQKTSK